MEVTVRTQCLGNICPTTDSDFFNNVSAIFEELPALLFDKGFGVLDDAAEILIESLNLNGLETRQLRLAVAETLGLKSALSSSDLIILFLLSHALVDRAPSS